MTVFSAEQLDQLSAGAERADQRVDWPAASWAVLRESGILRRSIPTEYRGNGLKPVELLEGMEQIASRCLTTAFVLSQREAAIRHLIKGPEHLRRRYLPAVAAGDAYVTVGLSQLTTSRQHLGPALRATPRTDGGYQLDGEIPWVTGADQAVAVIAGATRTDGSQILFALPAECLGGMIEAPLPLAALVGSRTSLIRCVGVELPPDAIMAGPTESVLGQVGGGGLDTSCLAIGLASAAAGYILKEAENRADLLPVARRFADGVQRNRATLHALAESPGDAQQTLALRLDCTKLALRATQAGLMIAKGIGFVASHPIQRWARQALFFLVWSCPRPVAEGVLADLANW